MSLQSVNSGGAGHGDGDRNCADAVRGDLTREFGITCTEDDSARTAFSRIQTRSCTARGDGGWRWARLLEMAFKGERWIGVRERFADLPRGGRAEAARASTPAARRLSIMPRASGGTPDWIVGTMFSIGLLTRLKADSLRTHWRSETTSEGGAKRPF